MNFTKQFDAVYKLADSSFSLQFLNCCITTCVHNSSHHIHQTVTSTSQQLKCIWQEGVKRPCCCLELMSHVFSCLCRRNELINTDAAAQPGLQVTVRSHIHIIQYTHTQALCPEGTQCSVDPAGRGQQRNIGSSYGDMAINMAVRNSTPPRPQATLLWLCLFLCCVSVCVSLTLLISLVCVRVYCTSAGNCWVSLCSCMCCLSPQALRSSDKNKD